MLENVKGLASARFAPYRQSILDALDDMGYDADWQLLNSSEFGVPQLRPRFILVAMKRRNFRKFEWPRAIGTPPTVGSVLRPLMASRGWDGAEAWAKRANNIAPTLVGGSKKHGGADLGPTRAKQAWLQLGVDGKGIADAAPAPDAPVDYVPRLTNDMAARVQGFAPEWHFSGRKTSVYRQIGNAFPPPVAKAIGGSIAEALGAVVSRTTKTGTKLRAVS
jgi:DNA (cytosine-5)-methyltransferase 1